MKIAGIVVEYNPLHNGHLYQIAKIRQILHPDLIVAVISGDFTQRGEPALLSKWQRTQIALNAGIDLVVELPYLFSVARADIFADGAISILHQLKTSHLIFGSESGNIEHFQNSIREIETDHQIYQSTLTAALKSGVSYPNAHAAAYRKVISGKAGEFVDLSRPNNSLGFHYIQAIRKKGAAIHPLTFPRRQAAHSDTCLDPETRFASGTAIRSLLLSNAADIGILRNKLPSSSFSLLSSQRQKGLLADWERFFPFLKYRLLSTAPEQLAQIYEAEEGIENRLLRFIRQSDNFASFIGQLKTKRYTWVRLQRLCVHILTHTLKNEAKNQLADRHADYIRLLGMSRAGQVYLSMIRGKTQLPIISKIRKHHLKALDSDLRAAQIYDFLSGRDPSAETAHAPIRLISPDDSVNNELLR